MQTRCNQLDRPIILQPYLTCSVSAAQVPRESKLMRPTPPNHIKHRLLVQLKLPLSLPSPPLLPPHASSNSVCLHQDHNYHATTAELYIFASFPTATVSVISQRDHALLFPMTASFPLGFYPQSRLMRYRSR